MIAYAYYLNSIMPKPFFLIAKIVFFIVGAGDTERNRCNQMNPNHKETGPVKSAGGTQTAADKDNRANQLNPNHAEFKGKKWGES